MLFRMLFIASLPASPASRLSSSDANEGGVAEDKFRRVMGHIVGLIEKDKHLESLVEKLCHRFRACPDSPRQWRDLSYCLSLFTYADKVAVFKFMSKEGVEKNANANLGI